MCGACLANHYGYGSDGGCQPCDCHLLGSSSTQCAADGQCPCKLTLGGRKCDTCANTFFSFPQLTDFTKCRTCNCDPRGSTSTTCDTSGQCPCKANASGQKCDSCKTGFFNVAEYNPRGCQPCFCFQQGVSCISATGFKETSISSVGTESWKLVGEYIEAPSGYLGSRETSYGQLISFKISLSGLTVTIATESLIVIEGDGARLVYKHTKPTVGGQNVISGRLFPDDWALGDGTKPSSDRMYRILANMTRLALKSVIGGTKNVVSSVAMVSAEADPGKAGGATFVENCTCKPESFVGALSCASCADGNKRINPSAADVRYGPCSPCSCGGRTYSPMQCAELTGNCLNCRNGTTGNSCESCAPNVVGAVCDLCKDAYWGLGPDGCRDCNCSVLGTVAGTVCDKTSGQCECLPHVIGRQCDTCEDNYYSLSATGCKECDGCYMLVMNQATELRTLLTNISDILTSLRTNDENTALGPFKDRLNDATQSLNRLLTFLEAFKKDKARITARIDEFNESIDRLAAILNVLDKTDLPLVQQNLDKIKQNIEQSSIKRAATTVAIKDSNTDSAALPGLLVSMTNLLADLKAVQTYLESISSASGAKVQAIVAAVKNIEETAKLSLTQSQADLTFSQSLSASHRNTSENIAQLQTVDQSLESLSSTALEEAQRIDGKSNATYATGRKLESERIAIGTLSPNYKTLNDTVLRYKSTMNVIKSSAEIGKADAGSKLKTIKESISFSEQQRLNTNNIMEQCLLLEQRIAAAERLAEDAQLTSAKDLKDATFMLETMLNFESKALEVENKAKKSQADAQSVMSNSQVVIDRAAALLKSLSMSQQSSALALQSASQAKTVLQAKNQDLDTVFADASKLSQTITSDLSDYKAKAAQPSSINTTTVSPARASCDTVKTSIRGTRTLLVSVELQVDEANTNVSRTRADASRILAEISQVQKIDTARIQRLAADVEKLSALFSEQGLVLTITQLKNDNDDMKVWLESLQATKAKMQEEMAGIKRALRQIIV